MSGKERDSFYSKVTFIVFKRDTQFIESFSPLIISYNPSEKTYKELHRGCFGKRE